MFPYHDWRLATREPVLGPPSSSPNSKSSATGWRRRIGDESEENEGKTKCRSNGYPAESYPPHTGKGARFRQNAKRAASHHGTTVYKRRLIYINAHSPNKQTLPSRPWEGGFRGGGRGPNATMAPRARKVAKAMAAIRNAEASGNRAALRAALDRAAAAPSNSAKSNELARMVSRHTWSGAGGRGVSGGGGGGGGSGSGSSSSRVHVSQYSSFLGAAGGRSTSSLMPPSIPGVPDSEVSDAWVAELMHTTGTFGMRDGAGDDNDNAPGGRAQRPTEQQPRAVTPRRKTMTRSPLPPPPTTTVHVILPDGTHSIATAAP